MATSRSLKAKADPNMANAKGSTALTLAAQNGHEQVARDLLKAGAVVSAQTNTGGTALMLAAQNGHEQVARDLLKAGASVDETEGKGWTALMFAAQNGNEQVALVLLEAGASLKVVSIDNFTMLMAASLGRLTTLLERVLPESDIDAAEVASRGGPVGALLAGMIAAGGEADAAIVKLDALDLPPAARKEVARLKAAVALARAAMPDLALTVDAVERRGFEYQKGLSFTIFARGVRGELGRGGRYLAGEDLMEGAGETATGVTLFTDTVSLELCVSHVTVTSGYDTSGFECFWLGCFFLCHCEACRSNDYSECFR